MTGPLSRADSTGEVLEPPAGLMPRVRVVVLNWNSHWFTRRCLHSLASSRYPSERLEIVVVDNGSLDGSLERLRAEFDQVRFVANGENLGFAEGCNRGIAPLGSADYVALVNNDAVVEPDWLVELVAALDSFPDAGAAAARLVLDPAFTPLQLVVDGAARLAAVRVDGVDATTRVRLSGAQSHGRPEWPLHLEHHATGTVQMLVPAGVDDPMIEVDLSGTGIAELSSSAGVTRKALGGDPVVLSLMAGSERIELLNGLGTDRNDHGECYDRFFARLNSASEIPELDGGPLQVPGFCGGGVLIRAEMLAEVGAFDPEFFAYYEDSDLARRAERAGWSTVTAPAAVIRHSFGGSGGAAAPGFFFLNYRNWLLTVLRNGDRDERRRARSFLLFQLRVAFNNNVRAPLRRGRRPDFRLLRAWGRTLLGASALYGHLRAARPGLAPTPGIRGPFAPTFGARSPAARPGGPALVGVDLGPALGNPDLRSVTAAELCSGDDNTEVIPVVGTPAGRRRLAWPVEVAIVLGQDPSRSIRVTDATDVPDDVR